MQSACAGSLRLLGSPVCARCRSDAFFYAFGRAREAAFAAVEAQRAPARDRTVVRIN